jgi:RNA polymerase sigma-70 factor (ECF subfamily)
MKRIYKETSEEELIYLIKGGNKREADEALLEVIKRNESSLKFYIMHKVRATQEREDVYNEVIEKLWKHIGQFDPTKGKISTWLFRITTNLIIDGIRRKKPVSYLEDLGASSDSEQEVTFEIPDNSNATSNLIEDKQRDEIVRRALDKTFTSDDPRRIVLELRYFNELSYQEIAEHTGYAVGSVKVWIFRAKYEVEKIIRKDVGSEVGSLVEA